MEREGGFEPPSPRYVFSVFLVSQLSALALEAALSECSRIKLSGSAQRAGGKVSKVWYMFHTLSA